MIKDSWYATYINSELGITKDIIDASYDHKTEQRQIDALRRRASQRDASEISLVAKEKETILGFARLQIKNDEVAELVAMYVHPTRIGTGIGSALWKAITARLPSKFSVFVEVAVNTDAVGFYKKIGFRDTGTRASFCITKDCQTAIPTVLLIFNHH